MKVPAAALTIACVLLTVPEMAFAKGGGGHGGGGHGGGHSSGHSSSGGHRSSSGHASSSSHGSSGPSTPAHRPPSQTTAPHARRRPNIGQPIAGTAVPRPISPMPPIGGGVTVLPSFPLFGLSGGFALSSYGGWPLPYANSYDVPTGGLRLQIEPGSAELIVDGYYAGSVDDFSGRSQHLDLTPGTHHLEVHAPGFQPLAFDVFIQAHHTIRFSATLTPSAP